jgi:dethiobiotin synthetase
MNARGVFVTGTDTDVGKTWVAAGLLVLLRRQGLRAAGMKPVSCGCTQTAEGPRNEDALTLIGHGIEPAPPYALVNRYAFVPPVAPHLAAAAMHTTIDVGLVREDLDALLRQADAVVVEGAGGWHVPLDENKTVAALLSSAAIQASGLAFAGWVANRIDPGTLLAEENIASLRSRIPARFLGTVPYLGALDGERIADCLESPLPR